MTTYAVCTTFSVDGFDQYGRTFIGKYADHWPVPLWCGVEGRYGTEQLQHWVGQWHESLALTVFDIFASGRLAKFLATQPSPSKDYRYRADPFCRKIYALADCLDHTNADWLIWLDADTITDKPIDEEFLRRVCQKEVSYLGRKDWHHSECGFVAYRIAGRGRDFLGRFVRVYDSGEVFEHLEWHDSYLFDRVREEFPAEWFHNLSEGVPGMHVWDGSPLGERMRHLKGPLRKKGKMPSEVEAGYWSERERAL